MTTKRKRPSKETRIIQHGNNLLRIFPKATERDPGTLCRKLRRLEAKAAALALRGCNGPEWDSEEEQEAAYEAVICKVNALLGNPMCGPGRYVPVFINRDPRDPRGPRGYALKIDDAWMTANDAKLEKDWGGYGLLAPEIK